MSRTRIFTSVGRPIEAFIRRHRRTPLLIASGFLSPVVDKAIKQWSLSGVRLLIDLDPHDARVSPMLAASLRRLLKSETVEVRCLAGLHAKLYLAPRSEVIVASANLSRAGFERLKEVAIETDTRQVVAEAERIFSNWWRTSTPLRGRSPWPFLYNQRNPAALCPVLRQRRHLVPMAVLSPPWRFACTEEEQPRRPTLGLERHIEQMCRRHRAGDSHGFSGADAAISKARHPTIAPPPEEVFKGAAIETRRTPRSLQPNIDEDGRTKAALPFGRIDRSNQLWRGGAPTPEAPRESCQLLQQVPCPKAEASSAGNRTPQPTRLFAKPNHRRSRRTISTGSVRRRRSDMQHR